MIFEYEGVRVARGVRYRPATRAELYVQARQLGLPGCSRMRKHELARAVARARRRPPALRAVSRGYRDQLAAVAGRTVALLVAALGRLRRTERIALPLAAVVLAGGVGAWMPVLIAGGTPEGVAALKVGAPIPASQASPDLIRPVEPPQKSARPAGGGASETGKRRTAVAAAQEGGASAVDQPVEVQARSPGGGAPEPSASPAPQAPAGAEPEGRAPTPEPVPGPTPAPPGDEEPEPTGEKATLCHKSGSKSSKTIVVGEDAVEEHLAHGDTLGACP